MKELSKLSFCPWTRNAWSYFFFKYERWMKNIYAWQMHDYIIRMLKISLKYILFCLTLTSGWLKRSRRSVMGSACRMKMCTWMQGLRTLPVVSLEGSEESRTRNRSHMMPWVHWPMIIKYNRISDLRKKKIFLMNNSANHLFSINKQGNPS